MHGFQKAPSLQKNSASALCGIWEQIFYGAFMLSNSSLGKKKLTQLKCSYVEIYEEITEILPAGNVKMFDSVEHWPG